MTAARLLAAAFISTEIATFGAMTGTLAFPAVAFGLVVLGVPRISQFTLSRDREIVASLLLSLPFVFLWRAVPGYGPELSGLADFRLTYCAGQYFILLQILPFFTRREAQRSVAIGFYGILAMLCAGNVYVWGAKEVAYQALSATFLGFLVLYFASLRREATTPARVKFAKLSLGGITLILALALSAVSSVTLTSYQRDVDKLIVTFTRSLSRASFTGFSKDARLGSVMRIKAGDLMSGTALRVFASQDPGYLRGRACEHYADSDWRASDRKVVLEPEPDGKVDPKASGGGNLFVIREVEVAKCRTVEVWPHGKIQESMFTPLHTAAVNVACQTLELDPDHIMDSEDLVSGADYVALVSVPPRPPQLPGEPPSRYRALPEGMDPAIRELAETVFHGCQTFEEKVRAVEEFFAEEFEYGQGITVPRGRDPLTYFLLERPAAHCEYFASGAAVLLRFAGVPTRYVTGFVTSEWNSYGKYWVAKNKDAHAWVEAYDEGAGWRTVEATPPDGRPTPAGSGRLAQFWDYLKYRLQELVVAIHVRGVRGLRDWLAARAYGLWLWLASASTSAIAVKFVLLVAMAGFLAREWRAARRARPEADPDLAALNRLLNRMDRRLQRRGLRRPPSQTLRQFALRIPESPQISSVASAVADWYMRYADVRYSDRIAAEDLERLAAEMPRL